MAPYMYGAIHEQRCRGGRMPGMRRTTVWLRDQEIAALRTACNRTRRTQSDLIREGIFMITRQFGEHSPEAADSDDTPQRMEWFTRQEHTCISLTNAGYTVPQLARELRVSEQETMALLQSAKRKMDQLSQLPDP
jgi:hypothetical protein